MAKLTPEQELQWYMDRQREQQSNADMLGRSGAGGVTGTGGGVGFAQSEAARYGTNVARLQGSLPNGGMPLSQQQKDEAELFGNARQRVTDLKDDPVDAMIRQRLQSVMSGQVGPYDATTKNALAVSQADQAGAAETARNQSLRDQIAMNGGSMSDPSAQAALRESMTQRQLDNQGSRLAVDMNANVANFNAAQGATGMLSAANRQQQQGVTQASQYLGSLIGQKAYAQAQPDYTGFLSQYLGGNQTTAAPAPQQWGTTAATWNPGFGGSTGGSGFLAKGTAPVYGGSKAPATSGQKGTGATGFMGRPEDYSSYGPNKLTYPPENFASPGIVAKKNLGAYGKIKPIGPNDYTQ